MVEDNKKKIDKKSKSQIVVGVLRRALERIQKLQGDLDESRKQQEAFDRQLEQDKSEMNTMKEILLKQQKEIGVQNETMAEQSNNIQEQKADFIQYFGLFVTIFTAISIDIQLLKFAQNVWQIVEMLSALKLVM